MNIRYVLLLVLVPVLSVAQQSARVHLKSKVAQERLGHSSVVMTADRYGHLFPAGDDSAALAAAEGQNG